jgi:hypothetical protein
VPDSWHQPVEGAPLPDGTIAGWMTFGVAQTGQLEKANGRTKDSIEIVERCEARDKQAVTKAKPKLFGIF